jgi:hypothetical protein
LSFEVQMVPAEIASFGRPQSVPVRQAKQDAAERAAYLRDIRPPPRTFSALLPKHIEDMAMKSSIYAALLAASILAEPAFGQGASDYRPGTAPYGYCTSGGSWRACCATDHRG